MQGKGFIKFLLGLMLAVSIYQFCLYIPTNRIEREANAAAMVDGELDRAKLNAYMADNADETALNIPGIAKLTYNDLKQRQLGLGLDLKGGMSVVMQVDLKNFLLQMSNNSTDIDFRTALDSAVVNLKSSESDYITLFADAWKEYSGGKELSKIFVRNQSLRDDIKFDTPDGDIITLLRERATETVQLTFDRLKERIDELGVVQPNLSLDAGRDLILAELPGIDDPARAREFLKSTAKLEFWNIYRNTEANIINSLAEADNILKLRTAADAERTYRIDTTYAQTTDSVGNIVYDYDTVVSTDTVYDDASTAGPLLSLLSLAADGSAMAGIANGKNMDEINDFLEDAQIKALFPQDLMFKWGRKANQDENKNFTEDYSLYLIKKEPGRTAAPLTGEMVIDARQDQDANGNINVSLTMNSQGAQLWGNMTTEAANENKRQIAILLDDKVVSAPSVNEPIPGGRTSISGTYSVQEAQDIANILNVGKLPAEVNIIQEKNVGPSLGEANIKASQWALIIGLILVLLFMILYYAGAGVVSIIALLLNIVFIFAALASYGTVLTLPGFAGIVLTVGMAVDANVIIFERIREELRAGKTTAMAIADGFKYSYSAIIDANVTTILTALVLAKFGLGPIKGFAVVLIIGVIASLFTAVLVGRLIFDWWTNKGKDIKFATSASKGAFANLNIDWIGKRKVAYIISGLLVAVGIYSLATRSYDFGVDFKGGYSYTVQLAEGQSLNRDQVATALDAAFGSTTTVKSVEDANSFDITTSYGVEDGLSNDDVAKVLFTGFDEMLGAGTVKEADFLNSDSKGARVISSNKILPTIADDIRNSSFKAGIFALLLIFFYIFIRFSKWQYSMGAVAALFHDVLIVLAVFSIGRHFLPFPLEIDQNFIAAILTVIGYSINDTVVVFDRIREFMGEYTNRTKEDIINLAINNTISRTIITSLTTLFVVAVLFFFGGESTKGLAFALMVGILVGTYSSVFVATPIMSDLTGELKSKEAAATSKKRFSSAV